MPRSACRPAAPVLASLAAAVLAALAAVPSPAAAQGVLDAVERRAVAYIDAHEEDAVRLLERTVNVNSGTLNPAGVRRVAELLAAELAPLGFETRIIEQPDSLRRGPHLVAERRGTRGKKVLLIGHLDTVFEEGDPFQRFVRLDDSTAAGPGVADMKGGNVVIVQALEALHHAGALEGADITVVFTGDEEAPGRPLSVSRAALIEAGKRADVALGFEGMSRDRAGEYAVIARRSSSGWRLTVRGRSAHSSGVFSESVGAGAIFEAARILSAFYEEVRGEEYLTFNPGLILGGTEVEYDPGAARGTAFGKTNVVAQTVVVPGGIRTISDEQLERARARMREVVARNLPRTSAEITFSDGYPAMAPTEANRALLAELDRVSRELGYGPILPHDPGRRGAADISFVAPYIEAGLDGLGVHGSGAHSPEERVDLRSIPVAAKRAAVLVYRLTRGAAL